MSSRQHIAAFIHGVISRHFLCRAKHHWLCLLRWPQPADQSPASSQNLQWDLCQWCTCKQKSATAN